MQKGQALIFLLVGMLIMAAIGGAFYLGTLKNRPPTLSPNPVATSQTPQPTSISSSTPTADLTTSWKTYQSNMYNFSVKYPTNLEANDQTASPPSVLFEIPQTQPGPPGFPTFYISVMTDPPPSTEQTYNHLSKEDLSDLYSVQVGQTVPLEAGKSLKAPYSNYWNFKRLPDTTIAGVTSLVFENNNVWEGAGLTDRRVLLKKKNKIYMLGTYYGDTATLDNFNLFVSTFKFTQSP